MSKEGIEKFGKALKSDEAVKADMDKLYRKSDADENFNLAQGIVDLGAKHGFDFTAEEMRASRDDWEADLTDEELEKISGGPYVYYEGEDESSSSRRRGW